MTAAVIVTAAVRLTALRKVLGTSLPLLLGLVGLGLGKVGWCYDFSLRGSRPGNLNLSGPGWAGVKTLHFSASLSEQPRKSFGVHKLDSWRDLLLPSRALSACAVWLRAMTTGSKVASGMLDKR